MVRTSFAEKKQKKRKRKEKRKWKTKSSSTFNTIPVIKKWWLIDVKCTVKGN
jgi:hypothetical protein